jgi:hypothetical protein
VLWVPGLAADASALGAGREAPELVLVLTAPGTPPATVQR